MIQIAKSVPKLIRTDQKYPKNFHTFVPRFGTNQTAPHGLNELQHQKTLKKKCKTSRIKTPTSRSLSKTPETGAHAKLLSRRAALLFGPKKSDSRIAYSSREKEDSLSLRKSNLKLLDIFFFLLPHVFFSFVLFLPFRFSFFSFSCLIFPSFLLLISLYFSLSFSPNFLISL